jgi:hypothetical protein
VSNDTESCFIKRINFVHLNTDFFNVTAKRQKYDDVIKKGVVGGNLNFLQLNYTDNFDKLCLASQRAFTAFFRQPGLCDKYGVINLGDNIHVHGIVDNNPVLGVCDIEQIFNETIRNNENVINAFIKENYFAVVNPDGGATPADIGKAIIDRSNIICLYGCSVGVTDKHWWRAIGTWLKQEDKLLVIIGYFEESADAILSKQVDNFVKKNKKERELAEQFMSYAEWSDDEKREHNEKILVELNDRMFNFGTLLDEDESVLPSDTVLVPVL